MTNTRGDVAPSSSRERLLDAALDLLVADGWSGLTSRKVASAAGVNVGLIHYYFGGMSELRRAAMAHAVEQITAQMQHALLDADTPTDVTTALGAAFETPRRGRESLIAAVLAGAAVDPELRDVVGAGLRETRVRIAEWVAASDIDCPEQRRPAVATLLMAALDGLMLHALADSDTPAFEAFDVLMHLLHGHSHPPLESER